MAGISPADNSVSNLSPELQKAFQAAVAAERKPIQALADKKANVEGKGKLLGDLIGKVEKLKGMLPGVSTPVGLRELAVVSADDKIVSATVDKGTALPGKFNLEVSRLASPTRALSNGFEDKNETRIGPGYFRVTEPNGEDREVFVDEENSTLEGVARVINGAGLGIRASVVNDQSDPELPFRLVMTSEKGGAENNVKFPEFYFLDGDRSFEIEEEQPAQNAVLKYEGLEIESPTNEVKDLIPGLSLTLRGVSEPGRPITLNIDQDTPKTTSKVKELVESMNGVLSFIQGQNKMDKDTPPDKTLGGDYGLRLTENRLRDAIRPVSSGDGAQTRALADIGVEFDRNGTLKIDDKKLETALTGNFDGVARLLAGDGVNGIVPRLTRALQSVTGGPGAVLSTQKQNFTDRAGQMQKDIDNKETAAQRKVDVLKQRLGKMQGAIQGLQSQSGYLAQQLGGK